MDTRKQINKQTNKKSLFLYNLNTLPWSRTPWHLSEAIYQKQLWNTKLFLVRKQESGFRICPLLSKSHYHWF